MSSRELRNGMKVRYHTSEITGYVHGVTRSGFSVRYDDGENYDYPWMDEHRFIVLSESSQPTDHDAITQELVVAEKLTRDKVENLLALYREGLALDLEEIADDIATPDRQRIGLNSAAQRLRKASDRP